jgi:hypothetical protein
MPYISAATTIPSASVFQNLSRQLSKLVPRGLSEVSSASASMGHSGAVVVDRIVGVRFDGPFRCGSHRSLRVATSADPVHSKELQTFFGRLVIAFAADCGYS